MNNGEIRLSDFMTASALRRLVEAALEEDLGRGDVTTDLLIPSTALARGIFRSRSDGVIAGVEVAALVFEVTDPGVRFESLTKDGSTIVPGQALAEVSGSARSLLRAERIALNFLQRLSGVATLTSRYVAAIRGNRARVVDTRKTTPGLRSLERYAVRAGGGFNHRRDLGDAMLIKDNHLAVISSAGLSIGEAIKQARRSLPHTTKIELELDRLDQIPEALAAEVDIILLDNMSVEDLRKAVAMIDGQALIEASGGISLATISEIAATGVDLISVGALTHSAPALDIGLDFELENHGS